MIIKKVKTYNEKNLTFFLVKSIKQTKKHRSQAFLKLFLPHLVKPADPHLPDPPHNSERAIDRIKINCKALLFIITILL